MALACHFFQSSLDNVELNDLQVTAPKPVRHYTLLLNCKKRLALLQKKHLTFTNLKSTETEVETMPGVTCWRQNVAD
jgi:hypothetical protein